MNIRRRSFLAGGTAFAAFNILPGRNARAATDAGIIGHGSKRYRIVTDWGKLDAAVHPVTNCHEMVEDAKGRLFLFQTNVKNNILIYDKSGKLLGNWGTEYPGAHGMNLVNENGEEFLFLTDTGGTVYKTDLTGKVVFKIERPLESGKYPTDSDPKKQPKYSPTNIMPAPDGSFFVGDGYGSSYVLHYDHHGKFLNILGGKGTAPENLSTPHGGMVDVADDGTPTLLICSRGEKSLKRLKLDGTHLATIHFEGLSICQIRKHDGHYYIPSLEGVVTVLDKDLNIISNLGGTEPEKVAEGKWKASQVDIKGAVVPQPPPKGQPAPPRPETVFIHPHGIWIDEENAVYVPQWNSDNTYPIKLQPVS